MKTYKEKLVVEHRELKEKLVKLEAYMDEKDFTKLSIDEQVMLHHQRWLMMAYVDVLIHRINWGAQQSTD